MSFSATHPYILLPLPPKVSLAQPEINSLLFKARIELAELNGYAHAIQNPILLMSPWVIREAVASSEIENINTTVIRALQNQLLPAESRDLPNKEVLRYRDALIWGFENMTRLPLSGRLIRGVQQKLMPESEGFRQTQNFIQNSITKEIIYTPPAPNEIPGLISNFENFIHEGETGIDPLLKVLLVHYQFEAIHPFIDGNGRTGRILMVLQLIHEQILKYPILYISGYINRHRQDYYRSLRLITEQGTWNDFLIFMLQGFYLQAKSTKETLFSVMAYREEFREKLRTQLPGLYNSEAVDLLFSQPIVSALSFSEKMGTHRITASRHLQQMVATGLLKTQQEGRNLFYVNHHLLSILSER
jgi:cell filamentation protein, protein adenylyltransferase